MKELGRGASGVVYRARHSETPWEAAIKILLPGVDPLSVERFKQEAHVLRTLDHPNIVRVEDIDQGLDGDADIGPWWMRMELVPGHSLDTLLKNEPLLSTERVIRIVLQICSALEATHTAGIVHRDLKPSNIQCFDDSQTADRIKILDFGIAKIYSSSRSTSNQLLGTVAYMSPEQAEGRNVDARSDLFSVGVILYQMLTGSLPFGEGPPIAVISKLLLDEPCTIQPRPNGARHSPMLLAILERLLRKRPDERFSNASELAASLITLLPLHVRVRNDSAALLWEDANIPSGVTLADLRKRIIEDAQSNSLMTSTKTLNFRYEWELEDRIRFVDEAQTMSDIAQYARSYPLQLRLILIPQSEPYRGES